MSWLDTILRRKATNDGLAVVSDFTTSHVITTSSTWDECHSLYASNSVIQGCALAYQTMMPEAPLRVHDNKTGKVLESHGLYAIFDASNITSLISTTMLHLIIGGNCYWYKQRSGSRVVSLYPLSSKNVEPIVNKYGAVTGYAYSSAFERQLLNVDDVIHIKGFWLDAERNWLGKSPVSLCSIAAKTYDEATRAVYSIHRNDQVPKTVIVYEEELSEEQREAARQSFARRHGNANKGTTAHLWGVKSIQRLGLGWQELGMDATFMQLATRICSTMRVHPIVAYDYAGLQKATYNNFSSAIKDFTVNTRVPLYRIIEDHITAGIATMYPDVFVRFDESRLEVLQPNRKDELATTVQAYQAGIITQAEARAVMGFDGGTATVVASGVASKSTRQHLYLEEQHSIKGSDEEYHKSLDSYLEPYDTALAKRLSTLIKTLGSEVIATRNTKAPDVDWSEWESKFIDGTQRQRVNLVNAAIAKAISDGGSDDGGEFLAAQQGAAEVSSDMIRPSVGTIREGVQGLLVQHADKADKEIAVLLEAHFRTLSEARANAIARTTSTAVNGFSQKAVWSELNTSLPDERRIVRQWVAMGGNTRDAHEAANGQLEDAQGMFTVGGERTPYPCGFGLSAKNSVNCRCFTRARRKGELQQ